MAPVRRASLEARPSSVQHGLEGNRGQLPKGAVKAQGGDDRHGVIWTRKAHPEFRICRDLIQGADRILGWSPHGVRDEDESECFPRLPNPRQLCTRETRGRVEQAAGDEPCARSSRIGQRVGPAIKIESVHQRSNQLQATRRRSVPGLNGHSPNHNSAAIRRFDLTAGWHHRNSLLVHIIDLTQPLCPDTVMWPGSAPPSFDAGPGRGEDGALTRAVSVHERSGTHLDAPLHFVADGASVDQIAPDSLIGPLAVVDVRERTRTDRDFRLSICDLQQDEDAYGPIERGSAVALLTGWSERRGNLADYLGLDGDGAMHFPGFGRAAAEWLGERRGVRGLGIDTAGIDAGIDRAFTVHAEVTLPRGVWHVEGLIDLKLVPARGATVFVGAIPFVGGTGAPARVIAIAPTRREPSPPDRSTNERPAVAVSPVYRITTFVPPENLDALLEGIEEHTPLRFGPYDRSAWWSAIGVEQFRPLPGSAPTVGRESHTERVPTVRLEFAIPRDPELLQLVLDYGLVPHHPWEEPAVFVDESLASASHLAGS